MAGRLRRHRRHRRRAGDHGLKPDITAPGVDIVAAKAAHGFLGDPAPVDGYVTLSGTSMATPHVAGAAAILTQEHPAWSSTLRKDTLMGSAQPTAEVSPFDQGSGRVDIAREPTQTISVDEGSLSFGLQEWPHGDDQPVTKTVTYRNSGTAAVDLTLSGPRGAFSLSASRLSGVDKEVESYDVSVRVTGLDGAPATDSLVVLFNLDTFQEYDNGGRVPAGRYGVFAWIFGDDDGSA